MNSTPSNTITVSPTNDTIDPLFDDWLVQDALKDDNGSDSSDASPPLPPTPAVSLVPHHHPLQPQELTGLTEALVAMIKRHPPPYKDRSPPPQQPMQPTQQQQQQETSKKKRKAEVSLTDEAALKRQKNTDAARRSRLKKTLRMEALESHLADLEKINQGLLMRVVVLGAEKQSLASKEASYEDRIRMLEAQLAETHKALAHKVAASSDNTIQADANADA